MVIVKLYAFCTMLNCLFAAVVLFKCACNLIPPSLPPCCLPPTQKKLSRFFLLLLVMHVKKQGGEVNFFLKIWAKGKLACKQSYSPPHPHWISLLGITSVVARGQFHRAANQKKLLTRKICLADLLVTSQTFIQNVCILAGSLFYIA